MRATPEVRLFDHLALQMMRTMPSQFRASTAQCVLGGIGVAALTFVCFRLQVEGATAGFAYLILIALLSLIGTFLGSIILSVTAAVCLVYFFAPPTFNLTVELPQDALALAAFLTTSLIVSGLTARIRDLAEQSRLSQDALINTIPALVWSARPDGSRDFHSRRWLEFTGLSAEEAAGAGWAVGVHPDDRARTVDKWRLAMATGEPFEVEVRGRNADGDYRWFLVRAEPLRDDKGAIVKWYGSSTDVEDAKRAAEALRQSEEQWREVFEHNPVMYFMVDASGTVLSVNAFGAKQLGYRVDELVGQSVFNVFFEEDRAFVRKNVAVCTENPDQTHGWEVRKIRKDGTVLWVRENAKAVRRPGNRLIVLIACEDITERKRAEDALRQSEMYLAEAQRLSHTGSFGWRVASGDIVWSEQTFRIFEYERTKTPSVELILQRTHPEERALVGRFLERVSREAKDWEQERRLLMPDGSVKHIHAVARAVKDARGHLEFLGAIMDVTAARRAEAELNLARAELAHVTRVTTMGELTATIAHEVNQPLTGVVTSGNACLRWLAAEPPNLEAAKRSVERMINDGSRASEVISRIRAMVRKSPARKHELSINDTLAEVITLIRGEVLRNSIALRTELADDLPPVLGDRIQLQQVILNLIVNAIDAMSGVSQPHRELSVASAKDGANGVLVTVRDSGTGLDQSSLDRLFEPFYTTKAAGMGMGLAISRTIIEAHGGKLWAAPNEPRGAMFRFRLPSDGGDVVS
jgi:PAS domain S-box-containing protein